jgi:type VI secretion system secreted protein VgrG
MNAFNIPVACDHIRRNAKPASTGMCARHVRQAIIAGGLEMSSWPEHAKEYGPFLTRLGFDPVDADDLKPGDIAVIQPPEDQGSGHVCMFDGEGWFSDFRQRDVWSGPTFRQAKPPIEYFRHALAV